MTTEALDEFELNGTITLALQLRTFRVLLSQVRKAAEAHTKPVVEVDLDLTAVMPVYRTRQALRVAGEATGIDLFVTQEALPILPGYSDEAWMSFVHQMDLETKYPKIAWSDGRGGPDKTPGGPFAVFHEAYWTTEWIADDTPTPGLGAFAHRIGEVGGEVVFISGRWLPEQVQPSITSLRRAGISEPKLVIGNDRHPTLVPPDRALSDSQIKVLHQEAIRKGYGCPLAILDDRVANRAAVIGSIGPTMLGIAVCIPGFTFDPVADTEPLRISTFEMFDCFLGDAPERPYMTKRYERLGTGQPWRGLYEGLGRNNRPYVLPRMHSGDYGSNKFRPFANFLSHYKSASLEEPEMVKLCEGTIPLEQAARIDKCLSDARCLASKGLAAPFPEDDSGRERLRLSLIVSWLHSRDIEQVLKLLGYNLAATGIHDIEEWVSACEIKSTIQRYQKAGARYSEWLPRWVGSLDPDERVNVGCLNPALAVGMWRWTPRASAQDAMDVHRVSSHHEGDCAERYDPIEAAVNNVLHQREGTLGIRKEPIQDWKTMLRLVERDTDAEELAKSSVGRRALRDAIDAAASLEAQGSITPWGLVFDEEHRSRPTVGGGA
jgi:hypothetical protein